MEAGAREIVNVCLPSWLGDRWAGDDVSVCAKGQAVSTSVTFVVHVGSSGFY